MGFGMRPKQARAFKSVDSLKLNGVALVRRVDTSCDAVVGEPLCFVYEIGEHHLKKSKKMSD